jgi:hypothetical protein
VESWSDEPWEYVLWAYLHLKDLDYRRAWFERMERLSSAELIAMAMHDPWRLARERAVALADAARLPVPEDERAAMNAALALAEQIDRGKVRVMVS